MSVISELMGLPGVVAAGEYAYRGDRYTYEGDISDDMARMASVMCRATTLGVHMEPNMLDAFCDDCGLAPAKGWAVQGPKYTVCVMSHYFCFLDNEQASLNETLHLMLNELKDESDDKI